MKRIGVLALQGAVSEHLDMLGRIGVRGLPAKLPGDLAGLDGLIIPGGESTAISRLIRQNGLREPIREFAKNRPVLGTCAGLILCAAHAQGSGGALPGCGNAPDPKTRLEPLGLIDIRASRNGFGRQADSFELHLDVEGVGTGIPAVFIRAPYIEEAGPGVRVMAAVDGKAVMAEAGNVLVTAFHPELTGDVRVHAYFCAKA